MTSPHQVTKDFERALCDYTGSPFAVAVTSCTMALLLAVAYHYERARWLATENDRLVDFMQRPFEVEIPKRTYVGVPYAIREAGGVPRFRDEKWIGSYRLKPLPVWDCARIFTSGMWDRPGGMACVSFHATKTLADTQGGAILHDDYEADQWLRRARFDGRTEGIPPALDNFTQQRSWHCYLSPDVSTRLLWQLSALPKHNEPLPNDDYPDLSKLEVFQ